MSRHLRLLDSRMLASSWLLAACDDRSPIRRRSSSTTSISASDASSAWSAIRVCCSCRSGSTRSKRRCGSCAAGRGAAEQQRVSCASSSAICMRISTGASSCWRPRSRAARPAAGAAGAAIGGVSAPPGSRWRAPVQRGPEDQAAYDHAFDALKDSATTTAPSRSSRIFCGTIRRARWPTMRSTGSARPTT